MKKLKYFNGTKWVSLTNSSVIVPFEVGSINITHGNVTDLYVDLGSKWRTAKPIKTNGAQTVDFVVDVAVSGLKLIEYNSSWSVVQVTNVSAEVTASLNENTAYIKFIATSVNKPHSIKVYGNEILEVCDNPNLRYNTQSVWFSFAVDDNVSSFGRLMLPPNYSIDGESVPLVVYVHGTGGLSSWNSEIDGGTAYLPYMKYIVDEGYALLAVSGLGNKYGNRIDGYTSYPFPTCLKSNIEGIKYVLDRYNLDSGKVYVYSKSLGGSLSGLLAEQKECPVKAVGMLAPDLDIVAGTTRDSIDKTIFASEFNLDYATYAGGTAAEVKAYILANAANFNACDYGWHYVGQTLTEKATFSLNNRFPANNFNRTSDSRPCSSPVKLWVAMDDDNITTSKCTEVITQLQNGGIDSYLRTMPNGTGGHHSVDTATNAPKVSSVTTALGIVHTNVPVAYVELVEWFNKHN